MPDVVVVAGWLGVLVTAGGAVAGVVKFGFWVFDEWQKRKAHEGLHIPEKTLQLAPKPEGHCWWAMGKRGDDPTMQIVGRMFVTNISAIDVRIPHAELRYGLFGRKKVSGLPSVNRGPDDNLYGMFDIPPGETRTISFDFWVFPPVIEPKEVFIAHSVRFMDQFGSKHTVRHVRFDSIEARNVRNPRNLTSGRMRLLIQLQRRSSPYCAPNSDAMPFAAVQSGALEAFTSFTTGER